MVYSCSDTAWGVMHPSSSRTATQLGCRLQGLTKGHVSLRVQGLIIQSAQSRVVKAFLSMGATGLVSLHPPSDAGSCHGTEHSLV